MKKILPYLALLIIPIFTNAQIIWAPRNFSELVDRIIGIIGLLVILIFSLTFLAIMWGVIRGWIMGAGDVEGIEKGKQIVFAGIIALVIMCSLWGILYMLQRSIFG